MKHADVTCPVCSTEFELQPHIGWRFAAAGAGGLLGGLLTRSFVLGVASAGLSYWVSGRVNRHYGQVCPSCHKRVDITPPKPAAEVEPEVPAQAA